MILRAYRGYRRILMKKKALKIGLLIPDVNSPYYATIAKMVSGFLKKLGHKFVLYSPLGDSKSEHGCLDFFYNNQCDGIIAIAVSLDIKVLYALKDLGITVVLADNKIDPHFPAVINDNYEGASALFEHMLDRGCRKIGWIGGNPNTFVVKERFRAFKDVMRAHNLEFSPQDIIFGPSNFEFGLASASKLILENKVDSIFGINDLVALGVCKFCDQNQILIPKMLKVAGFDDIEMSSMLKVPLTTVHQNKELLAKKSCELLLSEIKSPSVAVSIVLDTDLVVRSSC